MVGAVVIGRNEGERLRVCLQSLANKVSCLVYVDSGSTDHSLEIAESLGVLVVNLDMVVPFTAARARNEGFEALKRNCSGIHFVQFVDGDCEVVEGWLDAASHALQHQNDLAVVCGRRRERFPEKSIYNQLCDIEWDTPVGEADACGGDALIRANAFEQVGGYNPGLIAGEEPEMCVRLRRNGWKILRMDAEMTLHDADMQRFSQWWNRMVRAGHAFSEVSNMHRGSLFRIWRREEKSNWLWDLSLPVVLIGSFFWQWTLVCLFIYPLQILRIARYSYPHRTYRDRMLFAIFCMLGKLPLMLGQFRYLWARISGRKKRIIEYK